jgi:hypothetical protein
MTQEVMRLVTPSLTVLVPCYFWTSVPLKFEQLQTQNLQSTDTVLVPTSASRHPQSWKNIGSIRTRSIQINVAWGCPDEVVRRKVRPNHERHQGNHGSNSMGGTDMKLRLYEFWHENDLELTVGTLLTDSERARRSWVFLAYDDHYKNAWIVACLP